MIYDREKYNANGVTFIGLMDAASNGGKKALEDIKQFIAENSAKTIGAPFYLGTKDYAPPEGERGWTALMFAAKNHHAAIVTTLLAVEGIDTGYYNSKSNTALHWAVLGSDSFDLNQPKSSKNYKDVITALLQKMTLAEILHENDDGLTALQEAEYRKKLTTRAIEGEITGLIEARISALLEEKASPPPVVQMTPQEELNAIGFAGNTPNEYICPIDLNVMHRPIVVSTGHAYEHANLVACFAKRDREEQEKLRPHQKLKISEQDTIKCPITGQPIYRYELKKKPCSALQSLIKKFVINQKSIKEQAKTEAPNIPNALAEQQVSSGKDEEKDEEKVRAPDSQYEDVLVPPSVSSMPWSFWAAQEHHYENLNSAPSSSSRYFP